MNTNSNMSVEGEIVRRTYDEARLQEQYDDWNTLDKSTKLDLLRSVEPDSVDRTHNVTTTQMHEYFVRNLSADLSNPEDNVSASWMGFGNDAASGTATSDTDLNNRVYSEQVDDHVENGTQLTASAFLDSNEANGNTLDELGLFTGDPANLSNADVFLLNHATFADVTKDSTKNVTFSVTFSFSDA